MAQKFIRARGAEQVEIRRNEILNAAKKLYKERFFDDINILSIAKESGFTRSNIYRYFATKEEVYLSLIANDLGSWVGSTEKWLKQRYTPPEFAEQWVDKTLTQKRLLSLLSILSTKLEPNSSQEALDRFKNSLAEANDSLVRALRQCFPDLEEADANTFLMFNASLFIGTYPNMFPSKKQRIAMKKTNMPADPEPYKLMMTRAIRVFMEDMLE